MNWNEQIAPLLVEAWHNIATKRQDLFADDVNELSVSGALKTELQLKFERYGFVVDNEYNRMNASLAKRASKAIRIGEDVCKIIPDLIIHIPGEDSLECNLLAIELKKWSNSEWRDDWLKLSEMTGPPREPREFQYRFGLAIRFTGKAKIGSAVKFDSGKPVLLHQATLEERSDP